MPLETLLTLLVVLVVVLSAQIFATVAIVRRLGHFRGRLLRTKIEGSVRTGEASLANAQSGPRAIAAQGVAATEVSTEVTASGASAEGPKHSTPIAGRSSSPEAEVQGEPDWIDWLERRVQTASKRGEPVTRESAIAELDHTLAEDWRHVLLQRIGVAAPLFGVIVTAMAFFTFRVPEPSAQAKESNAIAANPASAAIDSPEDVARNANRRLAAGAAILNAIQPLATGVLVGAALAIVNQVLLLFVGVKIAELRRQARAWLDRRQELRGDLIDAATAGALISRSYEAVTRIQSTATQHQDSAKNLVDAVRQLSEATAGIKQGSKTMRDEVRDLQSVFRSLSEAATTLDATMKATGPNTEAAAAGLRQIVTGLGAAVEQQLLPAIDRQTKFSDVFATLLTNVDRCSDKLQSVAASVVDARKLSEETFTRFRSSWDEHVVPAQRSFQLGAEELHNSSKAVSAQLGGFQRAVESIEGKLAGLPTAIEQPVAAIRAAAAISAEAASAFASASKDQREAASEWLMATAEMKAGTASWRDAAAESTEASRAHAETTRTLESVLSGGVVPSMGKLEESATRIQTAAVAFATNIESSQEAWKRSSDAVAAVPDSTRQSLAEIRDSVSSFSASVNGDFATASRSYASIIGGLEQSLKATVENVRLIAEAAAEQRRLAAEQSASAADANRAIGDAATSLTQETAKLQRAIQENVAPAHSQLAEAVSRLTSHIESLDKHVPATIGPAAEQMVHLQQVAISLRATLEGLRPLGDLRGPISELRGVVRELTAAVSQMAAPPVSPPPTGYGENNPNGGGSPGTRRHWRDLWPFRR